MKKDSEKFEDLKILVLNKIQNATKSYPIKGKELCNSLNLPFRIIKELIVSLREEYPIVAKETDGGGYWIAESESDIVNYINMIEARKKGYEQTIDTMKTHLIN